MKRIPKTEGYTTKTEYDFSKAARGKFYRADIDLNLPREEDIARE